MQVRVKNLPRLRLFDLLKRRKTTLKTYLNEFGITSYDALCIKCTTIGVQPPTLSEYEQCIGNKLPVEASSQQDGIIVVEPIDVIDEQTGRRIDVQAPVFEPGVVVITDEQNVSTSEQPQKKRRKKKEEEPTPEE